MSILVIGGDKIEALKNTLQHLGATKITHWDARKKGVTKKVLPCDLDCVVMLTNYLNHNAMKHFKTSAKKASLQCIMAQHNAHAVKEAFLKVKL